MLADKNAAFMKRRPGEAPDAATAGDGDTNTLAGTEHTSLISRDDQVNAVDGVSDLDINEEFEESSNDLDIDGGKTEPQRLWEKFGLAREHEAHVMDRLASIKKLRSRTRAELSEARVARHEAHARFRALQHKRHMMPHKPGALEWLDSYWFSGVCSAVVTLNLAYMAAHGMLSKHDAKMLDTCFLCWYVCEVSLKYAHHGKALFIGNAAAVRWNWLDLGIVLSGIVEQWILPLFMGSDENDQTDSLAALRILRVFRILRILKLAKSFLVSDTDWIQKSVGFEVFMASVITVNAMVMSCELDIQWAGWIWVDNIFLTVYVFELLLRLKRWGRHFFTHERDWQWNWLDFSIVTTGVLDLWLVPGITIFKQQVLAMKTGGEGDEMEQLHSVMSLVRLTRLMRVLRLIRVLRSVPPLYTLLMGVIDAFGAMKWVVVLTLLTLYGGAIVFTNLVGKGMIYPDHNPPPEALTVFGTMTRSMFSLFELMNGDTSVIDPIKVLMIGKFLFAGFMVISNWAVLAILTAVVSENMIASSNRFAAEERQKQEDTNVNMSKAKLLELFESNDPNKNGVLTREEWSEMVNDAETCEQLSEGTHLNKEDLLDLFDCLTVDGFDSGSFKGSVEYKELVHSLKANSTVADKRSVLHVMIRMRAMQDQVQKKMDAKFREMTDAIHRVETHARGEGASL
jgi:hypothetical protein